MPIPYPYASYPAPAAHDTTQVSYPAYTYAAAAHDPGAGKQCATLDGNGCSVTERSEQLLSPENSRSESPTNFSEKIAGEAQAARNQTVTPVEPNKTTSSDSISDDLAKYIGPNVDPMELLAAAALFMKASDDRK